MKTSIVAIGNSKGVRIPKALLEESGLKGTVELKLVKDGIKIVSPPKTKLKMKFNEEYLLSLSSLRRDWDTPEEDAAWAHLQ